MYIFYNDMTSDNNYGYFDYGTNPYPYNGYNFNYYNYGDYSSNYKDKGVDNADKEKNKKDGQEYNEEKWNNIIEIYYNTLNSHDKFKVKKCCNDIDKDKYVLIKNVYRFDYNELILDHPMKKFLFDNMLCPICSDLVSPALSLNCGHSFCKPCFDEFFKRNNKCPLCRCSINEIPCENMLIKNMLQNFDCICPLFSKCNWKGKFMNLLDHYYNCEYNNDVMVSCKWCKLKIKKNNFNTHCEDNCDYRVALCKYCNLKGPFKYLKDHNEICEKKSIECQECFKQIYKKDIINHIFEECPYRTVICQYCNIKTEYININEHHLSCEKYPIKCSKCYITICREDIESHYEYHNKQLKIINVHDMMKKSIIEQNKSFSNSKKLKFNTKYTNKNIKSNNFKKNFR